MTTYSGSCLCGQARFRVAAEPLRVGLCHCYDCRKFSGAAFGAFAVFPADSFILTGKVSAMQSSATGRRYRCVSCGSPIYATDEVPEEVEISLGAFDQANLFSPQYESWTIRREHWLPDLPGITRKHEMNRT